MAAVFVQGVGGSLCSPVVTEEGVLFASQDTGEIFTALGDDDVVMTGSTQGQPSGVALDAEGNLFATDLAHQAVLSVAAGGEGGAGAAPQTVVGVYEDKPFKGPHSLVFDSAGSMFFTDSGPFGETGLHNPTGSVYMITGTDDGQLLKPLALECLAAPTGLCLSPDETVLYVAELMRNRVLRFVQRPPGVFHCSVFAQLAGGIGPSALACGPNGELYVAHLDHAGGSATGRISVLSPEDGRPLRPHIAVPAPEITGIAVSRDGRTLYVTEASTNVLYKVDNVDE